MSVDIEQRLLELERRAGDPVPGTQLTRVLGPEGVEWCLAIGPLMQRKQFFTAATIDAVLNLAEKFYGEQQC